MGKPNFDKLIVVDIECTCWEMKNIRPPNPDMEIIQIGACFLNLETLEIEDPMSIYVRPQFTSPSEYCTALTGITWDDVKGAPPLQGACNILKKKFGTMSRIWGSWGDSDREHFEMECHLKKFNYPFWKAHVNLCYLFSMLHNYGEKISLPEAVERSGLEWEGTEHDGKDDAVMTAKITAQLFSKFRV